MGVGVGGVDPQLEEQYEVVKPGFLQHLSEPQLSSFIHSILKVDVSFL